MKILLIKIEKENKRKFGIIFMWEKWAKWLNYYSTEMKAESESYVKMYKPD